MADAPVSPNSPSLHDYLDGLKRRAQQDFDQDIIWLTIHHVDRIATWDYDR